MIRVAICDDNDLQRELEEDILHIYAAERSCEMAVECFSSGRELMERVKDKGAFDLYLLDLIMPDMNGMEVAATLRMMGDKNLLIFLTSTLEYAVASYDVGAFYYMLKPIDRQRFFAVLDRALETIASAPPGLVLSTKGGEVRVATGDLLYVGLENRCPAYHLRDGRVLYGTMLRGSFAECTAPLLNESCFARCGVALVVNLKYVDTVDSESILLRDGTQLYPPKSSYSAFRKAWAEYTKVS